jgi:UDP-N-acetylmuramate--alanine ligase
MRIFFSGIAGSGVSALASFMADQGHEVSGSDRSFDLDKLHPAYAPLTGKGVKIVPQDGSGIHAGLDLVVFSTAVEKDLPEPRRCLELGLTTQTRPEFLADLVAKHETFAVAGTSGKSTTSGILAYLLRELGRDPSFVGGGRVSQFKHQGNLGNAISGKSRLLVVEACESDGSIVTYRPSLTLLLNLDLDHHSVEKTAEMFQILCANTARKVIMNSDDSNLRDLNLSGVATFGIEQACDYQAEAIDLKPLSSEFTVRGTRFRTNLPGLYNVYNALACLATLAEFGIPLDDCAKPLESFRGIDRRFDVYLNEPRASFVMDDYAHNPHKIASMMEMTRQIRDSITYVFQPHGFAPTRMMKLEYIAAFAKNLREQDCAVILPIFYVGGTVAKDISAEDLANGIRRLGKKAISATREEVLAEAKPGESFVVFGARDESLSEFAESVAKAVMGGARSANSGQAAASGSPAL